MQEKQDYIKPEYRKMQNLHIGFRHKYLVNDKAKYIVIKNIILQTLQIKITNNKRVTFILVRVTFICRPRAVLISQDCKGKITFLNIQPTLRPI